MHRRPSNGLGLEEDLLAAFSTFKNFSRKNIDLPRRPFKGPLRLEKKNLEVFLSRRPFSGLVCIEDPLKMLYVKTFSKSFWPRKASRENFGLEVFSESFPA